MINVKTVTLKEEALGPVKTFMFSEATQDSVIKAWADSVLKELNESGNYTFTMTYGTQGVYTPNEVPTLYNYTNDFVPIDYRATNP